MARTGRPRGFDRDDAVTDAMHLFWEHGYEGASLDALRHAMGDISSASFYAAFGSKETLYRESLDLYLARHGGVVDALLDETVAPRDRLERALLASVTVQTEAGHPRGCMVALSATMGSQASAALQALTAAHRDETRRAIEDCLRAGVSASLLDPAADIAALTSLYDALLLGVSIQARDGVAVSAVKAGVEAAMAAWDACRARSPTRLNA